MMKRLACLVLLLTVATGARAEEALDALAAIVNDDVITLSELNEQMRMIESQLRQQGVQIPPEDVLRRQVLERMIVDRVQLQLAASQGIQVDDETLNEALNNIAKQNGLTLPQFRDVLEKEGFDFADFREQIRNEIMIQQLRKRMVDDRITVTDAEVKDLLARGASPAVQSDEYHIAHILVAIPEAASPEEIEKASKKTRAVLEKLRGGADFQQTAIAVSEGQQALEGGDLGWRKVGELPTLFVDVVTKMKPGEVSDVIRSPSGFHIIKLLEARSSGTVQQAGQAPLREAADKGQSSQVQAHQLLRARKIEEETQALVRRLRDEAYVEYRLDQAL